MTAVTRKFWQLLVCLTVIGVAFNSIKAKEGEDSYATPRIKNIIVTGSKTFPDATIKSKLPYHIGERF